MSTRNFSVRLLLHYINYTSAIRQLSRSLKSCSLWQITRLRDVLKVFLFDSLWGSRYISDKSVTIFYPNSQVNPEFSFHIWTIHDVTLAEDQSKYGGYLRVCLLFAYILPVHVPSRNFYLEIILSNHLLRTWVHLEGPWLSIRSKNSADFSDVADGFSVRRDLSLSRRGDLFSLEPWATSSVVCFLRHTAGI